MLLSTSLLLGGSTRDVGSVRRLARAFIAWMTLMTLVFSIAIKASDGISFFRIGPHADFVIMGVHIDSGWKYASAVLYCFINSVFRTIHHSVINAWIINNVQDELRDKTPLQLRHADVYEIMAVSTVYAWWDWVIYIFILVSQIDMVLVEVMAELLVAFVTTHAYLNTAPLRAAETYALMRVSPS